MSGLIPPQAIKDVVEQTDMLAVVRDVIELRKAGTSYKGLCPFHHEKSPSFHVNPALKLYHCHGCGAGGDVIKFVRETRGLSFVEAVEHLANMHGIRLQREDVRPEEMQRAAQERSQRGKMLELNRAAQAFFRGRFSRPEGRLAFAYAEKRALGPEIAEKYGLGASGTDWAELMQHLQRRGFADGDLAAMGLGKFNDSGSLYDRFRNRLMYPIFTSAGDLVGFGGRDLTGGEKSAKYINSSEITLQGENEGSRFYHFYKKGQIVFGLWQARQAIRQHKLAILVEGNLDVMTLAQAGFEHAVCAGGTAITEAQLAEIKRFTDRVALVFDGDSAGRKAAMKAVLVAIGAGLQGAYVTMPQGEDPDSYIRKYGAAAFANLLKSAPELVMGYIDALRADDALLSANDDSLQSKTSIVQKAGPLMSSIADPILRGMALKYLEAHAVDRNVHQGNGQLELQRYLQVLPTLPTTAVAQKSPASALANEPEIPKVEQDFAACLVWYPAMLQEVEASGVIEFVSHAGLGQALRDLCTYAQQLRATNEQMPHEAPVALDGRAVAQWAQGIADGRARRALLVWVMEPPLVAADHAGTYLQQCIQRLQAAAVTEQIQDLKQKLRQPNLAQNQLAWFGAEMMRLSQIQQALKLRTVR